MRKLAFVATTIFGSMASAASALTLASPDIKPNAKIPDEHVADRFGCSGKNISPALTWSAAPKGAKSFAITVYDADAPAHGGFFHWVIFNLPPDATSLPKGAGDPKGAGLPAGALQSRNDAGAPGYSGPCPPKGDKPHHYQFTVFAVDIDKLDADASATAAVVGAKLRAHTLAKATLTGVYSQ